MPAYSCIRGIGHRFSRTQPEMVAESACALRCAGHRLTMTLQSDPACCVPFGRCGLNTDCFQVPDNTSRGGKRKGRNGRIPIRSLDVKDVPAPTGVACPAHAPAAAAVSSRRERRRAGRAAATSSSKPLRSFLAYPSRVSVRWRSPRLVSGGTATDFGPTRRRR